MRYPSVAMAVAFLVAAFLAPAASAAERKAGDARKSGSAAKSTGLLIDDEARAEFYDERPLHRCCVPSPTTRYCRRYRSRYVTGPRGPGTRSTLIPVSGEPVSANETMAAREKQSAAVS